MNLQQKLEDLERHANPHRRGLLFQVFVTDLLEEEGFSVNVNPKIATPRQTDLLARRDKLFFLIEAKWIRKRVDVGHIASVQDRLRRSPSDVFACVFSMSGFGHNAVTEALQEKKHEILLFNGLEIRNIALGLTSFQDLLVEKRERLRTNAEMWFEPRDTKDQIRPYRPSGPPLFRIANETKAWLLCGTQDDDVIFSREPLGFSGHYGESVASLRLRLGIGRTEELMRFLRMLKKELGLASEDSFAIHQRDAGWYGFGAENFVTAIDNWRNRYLDDLNWEHYHHSEELAYFDRLMDGGLMCLTLRQRVGDDVYLYSGFMEILIPGIPVDLSNIRRLCNQTDNPGAYLETISKNPVQSHTFRPGVEIKPTAPIVASEDGDDWACGMLVKNLFFGNPALLGEAVAEDRIELPLKLLSNNKMLFCTMRNWHKADVLMRRYELRHAEACWIENMPVLYVDCDWR